MRTCVAVFHARNRVGGATMDSITSSKVENVIQNNIKTAVGVTTRQVVTLVDE